ncbi:MAG: EamA family transporter [Candidatus Omnitrophica bacterium]|nr:EamA family transporter [Candidatus Omnitrophota bacterium]
MWIILALITALFTSFIDVIARKIVGRVNPYVIAWAEFFFAVPFLALGLIFEPRIVLQNHFWLVLVVSALLLVVSSAYYFKAIAASDLSLTIPILTLTPLLLLVTSPLMLGEFPKIGGLIGIVLIVAGAYVLKFDDWEKGIFAPLHSLFKERGPQLMLIVAVLYSIGGNIDKIGVRNSSPLVWALALYFLVGLLLWPVMLMKTRDSRGQIRGAFGWLLLMGFCFAIATLVQMYAIRMTMVPYIIAIKRMSVVFSSLFGLWLFHESEWRERLTGALLMMAGVFLISFLG